MKRLCSIFASFTLAVTLGCASMPGVFGSASPEAQIKAGADGLTAATTVATVALRNNAITVAQAKTYRVVLGAASTALDDANDTLVKCRAATGSASSTSPDPCKASVVDVIQVALDSVASVKAKLDAAK